VIASSDGARLVGYARVSTDGQELALQLDALRNHGVADELIFTDKAAGAKRDRAWLDACFRELRSGDILLVWRLDRLGRSVRHLVTLIDRLRDLGVGFRSVCDGAIDTTTPSGELIFTSSHRSRNSNADSSRSGPKPALLRLVPGVARVVGPH
jgi:DNA invertase Pin-like site-specific DNA recombinase